MGNRTKRRNALDKSPMYQRLVGIMEISYEEMKQGIANDSYSDIQQAKQNLVDMKMAIDLVKDGIVYRLGKAMTDPRPQDVEAAEKCADRQFGRHAPTGSGFSDNGNALVNLENALVNLDQRLGMQITAVTRERDEARKVLKKVKEKATIPNDPHPDPFDGPTCADCGSAVDSGENDWNQGKDACWQCKATRLDEVQEILDAALSPTPPQKENER